MADLDQILRYGSLLEGCKFQAVNLHPLADEIAVLDALNLSPGDCKSSDFYWLYRDYVFFLSVTCEGNFAPVVSYHYKEGIQNGYSFFVRMNDCLVTVELINRVMNFLAKWIDSNQTILDQKEGLEEVLIITTNDLFRE